MCDSLTHFIPSHFNNTIVTKLGFDDRPYSYRQIDWGNPFVRQLNVIGHS